MPAPSNVVRGHDHRAERHIFRARLLLSRGPGQPLSRVGPNWATTCFKFFCTSGGARPISRSRIRSSATPQNPAYVRRACSFSGTLDGRSLTNGLGRAIEVAVRFLHLGLPLRVDLCRLHSSILAASSCTWRRLPRIPSESPEEQTPRRTSAPRACASRLRRPSSGRRCSPSSWLQPKTPLQIADVQELSSPRI